MNANVLEPITHERLGRLRDLQGHQVSVALRDGSRLDDCQLVSIGRNRAHSIWLVNSGVDIFVGIADVVDLWESVAGHIRAA